MTRVLARCAVLLALLFAIAACGQKGPLVLPDKADTGKQDDKKQAPKPEPGR